MLVVGHVSEPRVSFDRPSLSFGKVLVGGRTHATINLLNSEHMPFQFDLDKASYDASPARLESTGLPLLPAAACMHSGHVTVSSDVKFSAHQPGHTCQLGDYCLALLSTCCCR